MGGGADLLVDPADDALLVDEDRHARRGLVEALGCAVQDREVAAGIGQQGKRQFQELGEGALAFFALGRIDRHAPDFDVVGGEFGLAVAKRGKLLGAGAGEALGEERQQQILLALKVSGAAGDAVHVRQNEVRRWQADFEFGRDVAQSFEGGLQLAGGFDFGYATQPAGAIDNDQRRLGGRDAEAFLQRELAAEGAFGVPQSGNRMRRRGFLVESELPKLGLVGGDEREWDW